MVRPRRLIRALCVLAALALLAGCASAPKLDPRDPDIWRPTAPAKYPLPR